MPDGPESYRTLTAVGTASVTSERSTFLATAAPAPDETAAKALVAALRRRHHDARHVCSAWRLRSGDTCREGRHDDGEPAGTAGEPILQAIRAAGLSDAAVAVVRYFGGVKLGMGGLSRAYGAAAAAALAAAPQGTFLLGRRFALSFPYARQKLLAHLLDRHAGRIEAQDYDQMIRWRVWLPLAEVEGFAAAVREQTAGRIGLHALDAAGEAVGRAVGDPPPP